MAAIEQRWRCFAGPRRSTSWSLSAYAYGTRGRLVSVTTDGSVTESYAYDLNGSKRAPSPRRSRRATAILRPVRRTGARSRFRRRSGNCHRTNSLVAADLRAAEYDAQDRLLSSGSATFTHDANGSLTNRDGKALAYDLFGQLASVGSVSYDRDALNRVTAKRVNGAIIKGWIYKDGLKPVDETDAAGSIVSLFV